jgi:two-component system CheB/CheR fusion protein
MQNGDGSRLQGIRVLVVEDDPDIRDVFSMLLRYEGADVASTGEGREALDIVARRDFDVLLTDLGLPDIPGDLLIRQVLATTPHRPRVVVVTGFGEPFHSQARDAGADAVLTKPVDWSRLLADVATGDLGLAA